MATGMTPWGFSPSGVSVHAAEGLKALISTLLAPQSQP